MSAVIIYKRKSGTNYRVNGVLAVETIGNSKLIDTIFVDLR